MTMFPGVDAVTPAEEPAVEEENVVYFDVHDIVYFVGGGPPMTITRIIENSVSDPSITDTKWWAIVGYYDLNNVFRRETFDLKHLTHGEDLEDEDDEEAEQRRRL